MIAPAAAADPVSSLQSLFDLVVSGGPVMWPLGLCSVIALAFIAERGLRLNRVHLGGGRLRRDVLEAARTGGAARAREVCDGDRSAMARILAPGLQRAGAPFLEIEKVVEDAGLREVRRLSANLRPLVVVAMIAPLLGLLGTVWGMIVAFSNIASASGLGRPEQLAGGISQALVTTAAGLAIAIPTQAAYYWFKSRIDRFARETEDLYVDVMAALGAGGAGHAHP